jgi:hypothetical protein
MLGKSLSATGSKNSIKGIRTKGKKGIKRSRSVVVRFSYICQLGSGHGKGQLTCRLSRLVSVDPWSTLYCSFALILIS